MLEITINKEKCTGCGDCVNSCPPEILYLDNDAAAVKSEIILECLGCQSCVVVCPTEAITVDDRR